MQLVVQADRQTATSSLAYPSMDPMHYSNVVPSTSWESSEAPSDLREGELEIVCVTRKELEDHLNRGQHKALTCLLNLST